MNVLHVSYSDLNGGAARAAYRIHRSLIEQNKYKNISSKMRVVNKMSDDSSVYSDKSIFTSMLKIKIVTVLNKLSRLNFKPATNILHSTALIKTNFIKRINSHFNDEEGIVNLHWLGDSTISIEEINKIEQPVVWTLHDQWPFCGAEHYVYSFSDKNNEDFDKRYIDGYESINRPHSERGFDINRNTWLRKYKSWNKKFHIVCPSNWMANCARESYLMKNYPIHVIPYPIDLNIWRPAPKLESRKKFNFPSDALIILFGAVGGANDKRKGADLLFDSLEILFDQSDKSVLAKIQLVVFGQDHSDEISNKYKYPINFLGRISNDETLRYLYASADIFVMPSRQDNLPQTAIESQACGTPVVGFANGGLLDIVEHEVTGYLAEPFDPLSLAFSIKNLLEDRNRLLEMSYASRARSLKLWDQKVISKKYINLYEEAFDR